MNLRNYDNIMAAKQLVANYKGCISTGEHTNFGDGHLTVKDTSASIWRIYNGTSYVEYMRQPFYFDNNSVGMGLTCGSGDSVVTYDDYKLNIPVTDSDCSHVSFTLSETTYDEATNTFKRTYKRIFAAKKDFVIKEIGFVTYVPCSSSQTNSEGSDRSCLMYRKVLDEPISVEANSNFELTFTTVVSACANKPAVYEASVITE